VPGGLQALASLRDRRPWWRGLSVARVFEPGAGRRNGRARAFFLARLAPAFIAKR